ncbi:substrate-binding domain-containing protein [Microvirga zambiensis]|uniref:substrate-binding domain-containing protein n=1 Tax=Microvirga zambiensis TaxID=1402137 RepID=UPI00191DAD2F|nr:substrate-binding domain-containing protein [Microvirga zambiensis]
MTNRLTGISSMATRQVLADLSAIYQQQTGIEVAIRPMGGVEAARLVRAGEPTDIVVLASNVMEKLEAEGHIVPTTRMGLARSGIAMAIRSGAPKPDIRNEEAVKRAILGARRICYSTGPSGDHLLQLWERWGVAEAVSQRALQAPPGVPVGVLLAQGEADLGFQQMSELMHVPGIEILGPLPPDIQSVTVFTGGVASTSSQPENSRALLTFLISPQTEISKRQHGMEPA